MHYNIDSSTFEVKVYDDINPEPFWIQPDYPNGDKFDSYEEAETWANLAVLSMDPEYGFFAPKGKGLSGDPKPTEEEIRIAKLAQAGLTVDDLKALLGL